MKYKFAPAIFSKKLAFLYDPLVDAIGVGRTLQKRTLKAAQIQNGNKILDIGCGTGTFVILAKKANPNSKVVGLDPDEEVLKVARKKAKKENIEIEFVQASSEKIPFPDKIFDVIVSSLAFHHLPTFIKKQALKEIYRILKPDGYFLLVDIGKPKNKLWKTLITIESIVEPKEYIKDNIEGKLIFFMEEASFRVTEIRDPYLGIQFLSGRKI